MSGIDDSVDKFLNAHLEGQPEGVKRTTEPLPPFSLNPVCGDINFSASAIEDSSVQNYETADSGLISRGSTYETLTLAGAAWPKRTSRSSMKLGIFP